MSIIEREITKKRRHLPIRKLVEEAGTALQLIKPCFMMSPMSIAQFLAPGSIDFDVVIFDEASQVKPEDAIGAAARGKQLIVVGDPKQLPPTTFFSRMLGTDEDDEECETENIQDYESILDKCKGKYDSRRLRMHYRSRHESLIQFSNHEFYEDSLVLFPNPDYSKREYGVQFQYVRGGIYDRGRSRKNQVEAEAVAAAVMQHAREYPDLSLGVGTLSISQREAVEDAIEQLRRTDASAEGFFNLGNEEPFFVKNLENIQGDERDVIYLSVGYGRDANGTFSMQFGPINTEGGWRRMNVLVTRARRRVEVFSSITYRDIDLGRTTSRGVKVLKSYLEFAETGNIQYPVITEREIGSEFQEAVTDELHRQGLLVEPEVGVAGFFIDIGVKHPEKPGMYILGIECDGATYHSARSARERDRLRQEILEGLGWRIHRIWSLDWFNNREREIRKVLDAYEKALASTAVGGACTDCAMKAPLSTTILRSDEARPVLEVSESVISVPYVCTPETNDFRVQDIAYVHQSFAAKTVAYIARYEGPMHIHELARRCSQLWGFRRTGTRIRSLVESGVIIAMDDNLITMRGDFIWPIGMDEPPVRNRSEPGTPKKITLIPPEEIALSASRIMAIHVGIDRDELIRQVARHLGIGRVSDETHDYISRYLGTRNK